MTSQSNYIFLILSQNIIYNVTYVENVFSICGPGHIWTVFGIWKKRSQGMGCAHRLAIYSIQCVLYHQSLWPPCLVRRACNQRAWGSILTHTTLKPFCEFVLGLARIIHSLQCGLSTRLRGPCVWCARPVISKLVVQVLARPFIELVFYLKYIYVQQPAQRMCLQWPPATLNRTLIVL